MNQENTNEPLSKTAVSGSAVIDIEKYRGIANLEFEMTDRIYQVFERRKLIAKDMFEETIHPNQMLYAQEEIKHLDSILKNFFFID